MISPKENVTTIMIFFYKDSKAIIRSPDGDIDFFDIVTRVLQGET